MASDTTTAKPIDGVRVGDEIVGPWGRYHIRVRNITDIHIEGVYTKAPKNGYPLGSFARYPKSDWKGEVEYVRRG